jgi:hypothetical protein
MALPGIARQIIVGYGIECARVVANDLLPGRFGDVRPLYERLQRLDVAERVGMAVVELVEGAWFDRLTTSGFWAAPLEGARVRLSSAWS